MEKLMENVNPDYQKARFVPAQSHTVPSDCTVRRSIFLLTRLDTQKIEPDEIRSIINKKKIRSDLIISDPTDNL